MNKLDESNLLSQEYTCVYFNTCLIHERRYTIEKTYLLNNLLSFLHSIICYYFTLNDPLPVGTLFSVLRRRSLTALTRCTDRLDRRHATWRTAHINAEAFTGSVSFFFSCSLLTAFSLLSLFHLFTFTEEANADAEFGRSRFTTDSCSRFAERHANVRTRTAG